MQSHIKAVTSYKPSLSSYSPEISFYKWQLSLVSILIKVYNCKELVLNHEKDVRHFIFSNIIYFQQAFVLSWKVKQSSRYRLSRWLIDLIFSSQHFTIFSPHFISNFRMAEKLLAESNAIKWNIFLNYIDAKIFTVLFSLLWLLLFSRATILKLNEFRWMHMNNIK